MKEITISIDDIIVSSEAAIPFYQQFPFPGDHNYELQINFDSEHQVERLIGLYHLNDITQVNWNIFFFYLIGIRPKKETENISSYFLNSVNKIVINPRAINLKGVCSTIIK